MNEREGKKEHVRKRYLMRKRKLARGRVNIKAWERA